MTRFHYHTSCIHSTGEKINAMVDAAREVSYRTFRRHCQDIDDWARQMGYDVYHDRGGLRLKNDWSVRYYKSRYDGRPCYYLDHSCIEHIWVLDN